MNLRGIAILAIALLSVTSAAAESGREACNAHDPLRTPHFGDLHVHTRFSLDASTQGTRGRPADAYRFAQGERIGIQPYTAEGRALRQIRLARPLDFAAVTDHAELFGEWNTCNSPELPGYDAWVCRIYRGWPRAAFFWMNYVASSGKRPAFCGPNGAVCLEAARGPWRETREAADAAYDRSAECSFTSFVGYEWTGAAGTGNNFHRNVIFEGDDVPELPISFIDGPRLDQLYARLRRECTDAEHDCDAVVIPHNSNLGGGMMFQTVRPDGEPITADDARNRAQYETLVEIMQHKGESECLPGTGSTDELCNFEKLAMNNFSGRFMPFTSDPPVGRQFVRNALTQGLAQNERIGVNPFKFGIIASTDTHLAAPGLVAENADYPGHGGAGTPAGESLPVGLPDAIDFNPGGLAVLWSEENSRGSLFAAMKRREAYGTSGPRIVVRFFGGWDYPADLCSSATFAASGYALGVPMGGDLPTPPAGSDRHPRFAVSALRDPGTSDGPGTALERVQIVKGWVEAGELRERVFDIAGTPAAAASVDPLSCAPAPGGHEALCSVWEDPQFDRNQHAFYYARVIEKPTCRWSQRVCNASGVRCDDPDTIIDGFEDCCAAAHQPIIQERAWTSPIWYSPTPSALASSGEPRTAGAED